MQHLDSAAAQTVLAHITHVYTDLDGTLLAPGGRLLTNHQGEPCLKLAEALVELKRLGIEVIIVTGRDVPSSTEIMRLANMDQFIAEMGCITQFGYGASRKKTYNLGEWEPEGGTKGDAEGDVPLTLIMQSGAVELLLNHFKGRLEEHKLVGVKKEVTYLLRGSVDTSPGGEVERLLSEIDLPLQLMDNGIIHPKRHGLHDIEHVHIYHLMPRGTGKGQAVALDIAAKGLKPEQTLAIGDARGDIDMGAKTGSFVLVNNLKDSALEKYAKATVTNPAALFATCLPTADGWTEFAHALLKAKRSFNLSTAAPKSLQP